MERWEKGRFKRTIKDISQFDNKKPKELESEFDHFDLDNSYPSSLFKGFNIVDLDYKHFIPQFADPKYCNAGQNKHL